MANFLEMVVNLSIKAILRNPNRKKILNLIKEKKMTITDISKKINLSYQNTFNHIKFLESLGLIKKEKHTQEQGQKVYILPTKELNKLNLD